MTPVITLTATASASLIITGLSSSAFKTYMFLFRNLGTSTGNGTLNMHGSVDGGASYGTLWANTRQAFDGTSTAYSSNSAVSPIQAVPITGRATDVNQGYAGAGYTGYAYLNYGTFGVDYPTFITRFFLFNTYTPQMGTCQAQYQNLLELNTLKFVLDSGTITRGSISIYGITA